MAELKSVLVALWSAASFGAAVHTAPFLVLHGWRLAGLAASCLRATSKARKHRTGVALMLSRHSA